MTSKKDSGFVIKGLEKLPLQVPIELLAAQERLGVNAVLVWINMVLFVQQHKPINTASISNIMHISQKEVNQALACLADQGWINDEGYEIRLCIPKQNDAKQEIEVLDPKQKGFEWLINFWANKVAPPTSEEMQQLLFWSEKKQMSYEVIAAAVEEMCSSIDSPNLAYLEGVLRNWASEGVYTYNQLLEKPYLAKFLKQPHKASIHPEAKRKWKEVFPDEFDS